MKINKKKKMNCQDFTKKSVYEGKINKNEKFMKAKIKIIIN